MVSSSNSSSEEEVDKSKKRVKKSKKHKKEKKSKKSKKSRKKSSSDSDSYEDEWVALDDVKKAKEPKKPKEVIEKEAESSWNEFGDIFSAKPKKEAKNRRADLFKVDHDDKLATIDKPGQHSKELNPYWKDGGTGLPEEESKLKVTNIVGDGGLAWLKKSYLRAKQEADDTGKSFEEIAESRWGSLENFYKLLEEAEMKSKLAAKRDDPRESSHSSYTRSRFKRPDQEEEDEGHRKDRREESERVGQRDRDRRFQERSDRRRDNNSNRPSWRKEGFDRREERDNYSSNKNTEELTQIKEDLTANIKRIQTREIREAKEAVAISQNISTSHPIPTRETNEDEEMEEDEPGPKILTDKEMNELGAKILKAELLGNEELQMELKAKLDQATKDREEWIKSGKSVKPAKVVTKVIMDQDMRRRKKPIGKGDVTHQSGERVRYFPDDDKYTLQKMFENEKMNTAEDENALFSKLAGKVKLNEDYDVDDSFVDKASSSRQSDKEKKSEVRRILNEEKEYKKTLEDCQWCFDGKLEKNLVIAMGDKSYLCVPPFKSLTEGHCLIVPMNHVSCSTQLDEDVWEEMKKFRQAVVRMYESLDQDSVIFELAIFLKSHPHMYLECVPITPKEVGELSPIYFKKAIQECETEWASNKKLVDLKGKDVRRAIPKGLPYFSVDFGTDSGFAHVIEDEKYFPRNFAQEIIGGMMELGHEVWRKRSKDDFKSQREKLMKFLENWGPFDFTR